MIATEDPSFTFCSYPSPNCGLDGTSTYCTKDHEGTTRRETRTVEHHHTKYKYSYK